MLLRLRNARYLDPCCVFIDRCWPFVCADRQTDRLYNVGDDLSCNGDYGHVHVHVFYILGKVHTLDTLMISYQVGTR